MNTTALTAADLAAHLNTHPADYGLDPYYLRVDQWTVWEDCTSDLSNVAIWVAEPHDADSVQGLIGYFLTGPAAFGGEWDCGPILPGPDGGTIFLFTLDGTKSAHDDIAWYISDHFETYLTEGTPLRTTNKAGPGTAGTRKWPGLHGPVAVAWR